MTREGRGTYVGMWGWSWESPGRGLVLWFYVARKWTHSSPHSQLWTVSVEHKIIPPQLGIDDFRIASESNSPIVQSLSHGNEFYSHVNEPKFVWIKLLFTWKALHLDSLWNRCESTLGVPWEYPGSQRFSKRRTTECEAVKKEKIDEVRKPLVARDSWLILLYQ